MPIKQFYILGIDYRYILHTYRKYFIRVYIKFTVYTYSLWIKYEFLVMKKLFGLQPFIIKKKEEKNYRMLSVWVTDKVHLVHIYVKTISFFLKAKYIC